jgi:D-alanine-D-alanine ligase
MIGLVFDSPEKLIRTQQHPFPEDAQAEWETSETIGRIKEAWKKNGATVVELPLDHNFLSRWSQIHSSLDLVHSLVEGWGTPSRESWIPSLCELSGVPYIGSGPSAQCIAMRKSSFKILCRHLNIPTPAFLIVQSENDVFNLPEDFLQQPHFIKPDCEGSGMGIDLSHSVSESPKKTRQTCLSMLKEFPDGLIIEERLGGIELTSAFLGDPRNPETFETLPIAQIDVDGGVYGLTHKSKEQMTEKVTFPNLNDTVRQLIKDSMLTLSLRSGLEDFTRFDWKLNDAGIPQLLEANPLAGLSYYYSVLPKMAAVAGYSYDLLLARLAQSALSRKGDRRFWYGRARLLNQNK